MLFQTMMADHEEEILAHHATIEWNDPDIARAYTLAADLIRDLDQQGHIAKPVYVPHMTAYAI
jgi:hypothetical protein